MELTGQPDSKNEPTPVEAAASESFWAKWATVVIVGEVCLFALFVLVGSMFRTFNLGTYLAAAGVSTFLGGRLGGLRGVRQWLSAAVLIVLASFALAYLMIFAVAGMIRDRSGQPVRPTGGRHISVVRAVPSMNGCGSSGSSFWGAVRGSSHGRPRRSSKWR